MIKVRLKENCRYHRMTTPYGIITHSWSEVIDTVYIYKEMEVLQEATPELEPVETVEEKPVVKEEVVEDGPEPIEEKLVKKKRKRKR